MLTALEHLAGPISLAQIRSDGMEPKILSSSIRGISNLLFPKVGTGKRCSVNVSKNKREPLFSFKSHCLTHF